MSELTYRVRELTKRYADRQVLRIAALDIYPGEILVIVGPSGAGKSTLLRLLNFLEPADSGSIRFQDVDYLPDQSVPLEVRRKVTMLFQRPLLLDASVWENVAYGLRLRGERHPESRVDAALEQVGMAQQARQRARTLSGGEAQRVALARAMLIQPDALLLDEPTANLDPYNVGMIEQILSQINQVQGTTLVLVTHNVFQARRLAQRAGLMLEGKIIEIATAEKFFNQPADARTAAFSRGEMIY
jgi:tungstate transport system ATP-binding protein